MMLSQKSQSGCLVIYCLLTSLKLNFFLLVFLSNCLSYPIISLLCLQTSISHILLLLAILGSSLTPHCLCLTTYLPFSALTNDFRHIWRVISFILHYIT